MVGNIEVEITNYFEREAYELIVNRQRIFEKNL